MKIAMVHPYQAPAKDSMGAERVVESLTRGLLNLGHEVVMKIHPDSTNTPAPVVQEVPADCDIIHYHQWHPEFNHDQYGIPWVSTIHGGGGDEPKSWRVATEENPHLICVSQFIQNLVGGVAHAWTCSDPDDFIFSPKKDDYFLWCAGTDWGEMKGLFSTIQMAKLLRINLVVAGTGRNQATIEAIKNLCDNKIKYVGPINGKQKAEYFSKAKALILLTKLNDACPVSVGEAFLSGTPVIGSDCGAMPELITDKVGFVVKNRYEFAQAVTNINKISTQACYEYGLEKFSHKAIALQYVRFYENMLRYGSVQGK